MSDERVPLSYGIRCVYDLLRCGSGDLGDFFCRYLLTPHNKSTYRLARSSHTILVLVKFMRTKFDAILQCACRIARPTRAMANFQRQHRREQCVACESQQRYQYCALHAYHSLYGDSCKVGQSEMGNNIIISIIFGFMYFVWRECVQVQL